MEGRSQGSKLVLRKATEFQLDLGLAQAKELPHQKELLKQLGLEKEGLTEWQTE